MKVLIAPNAMKGSLDAFSFAEAIEKGLSKAGITDVVKMPVCDGGDGSAKILGAWTHAQCFEALVHDPLGRLVHANFYLDDQNKAYLDLASTSGMCLLKKEELNPFETTTFGAGELMLEALNHGAKQLIIGLGGTATVDGGMGALQALGVEFFTRSEMIKVGSAKTMADVVRIDCSKIDKRLSSLEKIVLLTDVDSFLLGEKGAVYVFAPQKGASEENLPKLERNMALFAGSLFQYSGIDVRTLTGGGAAGGFASSFYSILGAEIKPGADYVLRHLDFDRALACCDCVVTGEGRVDEQTFSNKAPYAVLNSGTNFEKPVYMICGTSLLSEESAFCKTYQLVREPVSTNEAFARAFDLVVERSEEMGNDINNHEKRNDN